MTKQEALKQVEDLLVWEEPKPKRNLINEILKECYNDDAWVMQNLVYSKNPLLDLIKDETAFKGSYFPIPK